MNTVRSLTSVLSPVAVIVIPDPRRANLNLIASMKEGLTTSDLPGPGVLRPGFVVRRET